jgi:hypothetical protein
MRFAYIDSHGNEVPIPSVDALALRIELGAIGPDTQLYDAQADHWGPASTHEIFHTLSRDAQADGFVAPPPVAPPPAPPAAPVTKAEKPKPRAETKPEQGSRPTAKSASDLGLTLADPAPPPKPPALEPGPSAGALDLSLDLASTAEPKPKAPSAAGEGGGTFDYGDLSSGLQLEESPLDVQPTSSGMGAPSFDMPLQFGEGGGGGGLNDLQLEQPMSAFTPDSPPGWMEQEPPPGSDLMSFSTVPAAAEARSAPAAPIADAPERPKRAPRDRPSPPKFKQRRSLAVPIVLGVLLLAVGVGGYVGWPLLQARLAQDDEPLAPVSAMPALPPELVPRMRELAEGAVAAAIAEVDANTRTVGAPTEPDQRWLGGNYLANASQFASIEVFWSSIGEFMDGVRAADWGLYHDKMVEGARAAGLEAEESGRIIERADSGFAFASATRADVYATLDGVVDAALTLHRFLVENEANIEYRPASTSTADPILEAVPSSTAIGDRMLELVDGVTEGLSDLGTLERVTRDRLVTALTGRIQQVGIQ